MPIDLSDIVGFDKIDDVADGIQTFLYGIVYFVMDGADVLGNETCFRQIGSPFQAYGKTVETRPVGLGTAVVLDAHLAVLFGDGGNHRRVETPAEQHTIGHVGHQLSLHGFLQSIVDGSDAYRIVLHGIIFHPIATVIPLHARLFAPIVMTWQERLVTFALAFECLQFGGYVEGAIAVVANVEWYDADGVAGDEEGVTLLVVEHEGEDAAQVLEKVDAFLTVERQNDFAIATRLECILSGHTSANFLMVVNLAIHRQDLLAVGCIKRLPATLGIDDAQSLMGKDGGATTIDAAPIGTAMTYFLTHFQCLLAK